MQIASRGSKGDRVFMEYLMKNAGGSFYNYRYVRDALLRRICVAYRSRAHVIAYTARVHT